MEKIEFWNSLSSDYGITLNSQQQRACSHTLGPSLTLAIPGSGKTTLLVCRTCYLTKVMGVPESKILCLTFSRAAAADMKRRYVHIFKNDTNTLFSTIHSFAYRLLKLYYSKNNLTLPALMGSDENSPSMKKIILDACKMAGVKNISSDISDEYSNYISLCKNLRNIECAGTENSIKAKVYQCYEKIKSDLGLIDFDDMIILSTDILNSDEGFRNAASRQFSHILLDEAQDTSHIQNEFIDILVQGHGNLFAVADDDQSIYGFRGAFPEAIISFSDRFKNESHIPPPVIYGLDINYRSTSSIVNLSREVINLNASRHVKKMKSASKDKKGRLELHIFDAVEQRNDFLTEVESLLSINPQDSLGILYRNNISAVSVAHQFINANIPFRLKEPCSSFFDSFVFKDIISFLEHCLNPSDFDSINRIYFKTRFYVSKDSIQFAKNIQGAVLANALENPDLKSWQSNNLSQLEKHFKALAKLPPSEAISYICNDFGYFEYLAKYSRSLSSSLESLKATIDALKDVSMSFYGILEFLIGLEEFKDNIKFASTQSQGRIYMTTMHSAKGLEFDNVIILDGEQGIIPSYEALDLLKHGDSKLFEEERRLFYVALTRAATNLFFLMTKYRYGSRTVYSQFMDEALDIAKKLKTDEFQIVDHCNDAKKSYKELPGQKINHIKYGIGIIKDVNENNIASIEFYDGNTKNLSLEICMEKRLISFIE